MLETSGILERVWTLTLPLSSANSALADYQAAMDAGPRTKVAPAFGWDSPGCHANQQYRCLQALAILREQNQDAFFGLLSQNLTKLLPVIYTPTVGDACKQWSTLMQRPQGLYVCIKDKV